MSSFFKITFLSITTMLISCVNKEFKKTHIDLKERGNVNCQKLLQIENESIYDLIEHKRSIILTEDSNCWSEIAENKIKERYKKPLKYSHQFKLTNNKWINYEFHLMSDEDCKCDTILSYYEDINEQLNIYEEIILDKSKVNYIEEIGKSKLKNKFKLILVGENFIVENLTIFGYVQRIPKLALDWKFKKYGFLLVSTEKDEGPIIYSNTSILIDLNNLEIVNDIKPNYEK